eukprot:TRINITY_DN76235_c0_g1_i1.p1 TRINITY_DN76235_c0_g1~~TRINITY_DN76235_c0_g1_i1.p1  ORF type:complete len:410 (-),score=83.11 TRINITY_DN76235_c0_g1_i1:565-1770(-)
MAKRRRVTGKEAGDGSPSTVVLDDAAKIAGTDELDGELPDAADNEKYFCAYAFMYHQMSMLEDSVRTGAYYDAIVGNPECFKDKVVLDVGAGTCILSMMAARAGARLVFAVEATAMADRGKKIVEANGLHDRVRVVRGTVESIKLPCKVDVIVSEWMGYFLLRESMLDSVLIARDKFLKPGGSLFPSHATLYLAPVANVKELAANEQQLKNERQHWTDFSGSMRSTYKFTFACVQDEFEREERKYYLQTGTFVELAPRNLVGTASPILEIDLLTVGLAELQTPAEASTCTLDITRDGPVQGFCGYFDTFFRGSPAKPAETEVVLGTGPTTTGATHWGQQAFGFHPPLAGKKGDRIECSIWIRRQEQNHRLLWLTTKFVLCGPDKGGKRIVKDERGGEYFVD